MTPAQKAMDLLQRQCENLFIAFRHGNPETFDAITDQILTLITELRAMIKVDLYL